MRLKLNLVEKIVLYYGSGLFFLGVYLAIFNQAYFDRVYSKEDGVLEWITVLVLITGCFFYIKKMYLIRVRASFMAWLVTCGIAFLFFFGAGEELSWGQRLFNLSSPEFFTEHNAQKETNLHNLMVGDVKLNKLIFGQIFSICLLSYLFVLTPLYRRKLKVRKICNAWQIPIPHGYQVLGYLFIVLFVEGIVQVFSETGRRGELTEFAAVQIFFLNMVYPSRLSE